MQVIDSCSPRMHVGGEPTGLLFLQLFHVCQVRRRDLLMLPKVLDYSLGSDLHRTALEAIHGWQPSAADGLLRYVSSCEPTSGTWSPCIPA
jgi:hypothetical protein